VRAKCIGLLSLLFWVSASCAQSPEPEQPDVPAAGAASVQEDPCERAALGAVPRRVTDVVDHLNALPKPVSLPCLLTSLPRPLSLHATRSVLSAQPAVGLRSPRVFVLYDELIMSVALDGMGKDLLEFGERRPDARSLKAEIEFPVAAPLKHAAPFERIVFKEEQSSCAFCHAAESRDESIDFATAFVSVAYRPTERQSHITVAEMAAELARCDREAEPQRCEMLESLFARGMPIEQAFPMEFTTFQ
jgi:hypothetical protein